MTCSFKEAIVIAIICVILFPCYAVLGYTYIPVTAQTCDTTTVNLFIDAATDVTAVDYKCLTSPNYLLTKVNLAIYIITLMTIFGWSMLVWFLPVGMWAFPFEYVGIWLMRPKPMKPEEFTKSKMDLA